MAGTVLHQILHGGARVMHGRTRLAAPGVLSMEHPMRALYVGALVSLLGGAGCLRITNNNSTLLVDLSFGGVASCSAAGVDSIRYTSPTDTETVPCAAQIEIAPIPIGTDKVQLSALSQGIVTFTATFNVDVPAGGAEVPVDLTEVPGGNQANVTVDFIFGAPADNSPPAEGMTCAEAGVQSVSVTVDDGAPLVANCHDSITNPGRDAAVVPTTAGTHKFVWSGYSGPLLNGNVSGNMLYQVTLPEVPIQAGNATEYTADMKGLANGGLDLGWSFNLQSNATDPSCSDAGVANITYSITDAAGTAVSGLMMTVACTADLGGGSQTPVQVVGTSPGLAAGVYFATLNGTDGSGTQTFTASNARVYVPAGVEQGFVVTLNAP
jgi:hypothetical protein